MLLKKWVLVFSFMYLFSFSRCNGLIIRNSIPNLTFSHKFSLLLFKLFLAEHKVSGTEKYYFGFDVGKKSLISDFSKLNNFN